MSLRNLQKWPIFSLLERKFVANIRIAIVYGNLGNEALIVTKDKMVYAVGNNTNGCLGTGDTDNIQSPKKIKALCDKDIKTFAYGKGPHVLALTMDGQVYSWGHNSYYELGNGSTVLGLTPILVEANLKDKFIVAIACGGHHSLALTDEGMVYAWGRNNCGQVDGSIDGNQRIAKRVNYTLADKKIVSISCGHSSSIAVTNKGEVYGWGCNTAGELGIGNCINQTVPCKITQLSGIVITKVVCGYSHALALSNNGVLYTWGANSHGQLGLNVKMTTNYPVKLDMPKMEKVLDIATSHYSHISVATTAGNHIFVWGQCLGLSIATPILFPECCLHDALASFAWPRVMHQPFVLRDEGEETSITDCLKGAFDDLTTSDLIIRVRGKAIHVHKAVLKIRCKHFRTMFQEYSAEEKQSVIEHCQFSYDVYRAFLKYLYTDEVDLQPESAQELLDLANVYSENRLKKCCVEMMKKGITVENAISLYSTAIAYNVKELEEYCFEFALKHMSAVIETRNFAELDESTRKHFITEAARMGTFKR
ncbi:RCC1 and BTB domain-containing protein 1-like isoform X2 [Colletes latitarsis]|uniref:RCC1 and BTB domain-containing protein 1-like isoform X2 n=1 Tax=Colletes latitarsis TaxID=2605962 RepID=UPI004036119C